MDNELLVHPDPYKLMYPTRWFKDDLYYDHCNREIKFKTKEENTMAEKKLYQIGEDFGGVKYGHKLAVNSAGKWVMEIKGTGEVITCDKDNVEEVMPYTVSVQFETGKTVYHYLAEKGSVELNAFYIFDSPMGRAIAQVIKLDTKSPAATKEFKPLAKLLTANVSVS
jgi:hypothetical protein